MPEMYLRQHRSTYSACGPFTKNRERIQNFKESQDSRYIHRNELGKTCFKDDMFDGYFKDLTWTTASVNYYINKH